MSKDTNLSLIERAQADLDRVESKIAGLQGELQNIQAELQNFIVTKQRFIDALDVIKSYINLSNIDEKLVISDEDVVLASKNFPRLAESNPMYGKSVPEAAVYLIAQAKRPLTAREIVNKMQGFGVVFTMPDPIMNANLSLNKRKNLVTRIQGGKWSIKPPETKGVENPPDTGCVKRVSDDDHYAKTLAGLAAARARGVRGGRKPVMVNGKDEKARELLRQGMSPTKVAQDLGISRSAIYRFIDDNNIERGKKSKIAKGTKGS